MTCRMDLQAIYADYADALDKAVNDLTDAEKLQAFIDEMIRQGGGGPGAGTALPDGAPAGAWVEIKEIKGRPYRYLRWRDGRHMRSKYLGKALVND